MVLNLQSHIFSFWWWKPSDRTEKETRGPRVPCNACNALLERYKMAVRTKVLFRIEAESTSELRY